MSVSCYIPQRCDILKQTVPVNTELVKNDHNLIFYYYVQYFLTECWTMVESQGWEQNRTDTI